MDGVMPHDETGEKFLLLPFSEQFLVWAARMWVDALQNNEQSQLLLTEGFIKAGAADAQHVFDRMMWVLAAGASSTIDVRCPSCESVSPDEQRLLAVLAARQGFSGGDDPAALMEDVLTPTGMRFFTTHSTALAQALSEIGMFLRPRSARPMSDQAGAGASDAPVQTLH